MGCDYYDTNDISLHFSDNNDDWICLCTFPHNDQETLNIFRLRSLALLGAAVVLAHNNQLDHGFLPDCVPTWIRNEIIRLLPYFEEE